MEHIRFHDLRHETTSRLFEKGLNPVEVATITGHKDTKMLMRYTHLRAEDLVGRVASRLACKIDSARKRVQSQKAAMERRMRH